METPHQKFYLNCSEKPLIKNESKLSDILEINPNPKYLLSPKACQGILRRAEKRGKELPKILQAALEKQASYVENEKFSYIGDTEFKPMVENTCGDTTDTLTKENDTPSLLDINGGLISADAMRGYIKEKNVSHKKQKKVKNHNKGQDNPNDLISNEQTINQNQVCFGISSFDSNAMKSPNPHSGIYEANTTRTLDNNGGNPACNQGGMAIVSSPNNLNQNVEKEEGFIADAERGTDKTIGFHLTQDPISKEELANAISCGSKQGQCTNGVLTISSKQQSMAIQSKKSAPLSANDFKEPQVVVHNQAEPNCYDLRISSDGTKNWRAHCYETNISRSLDTGGENPDSNHGGVAIIQEKAIAIDRTSILGGKNLDRGVQLDVEVNSTLTSNGPGAVYKEPVVCLEGNGCRPSHKGDGYKESEISYTLNSTEQHGVCHTYRKKGHPQNSEQGQGWEETHINDTLNVFDNCEGRTPTLILENHPADSRVKIKEDGVVQTLSGRMGTGGGNVPMVLEGCSSAEITNEPISMTTEMTPKVDTEGTAFSLRSRDSKDAQTACYGLDRAAYNQGKNAKYDFKVEEDIAQPLMARGPGAVMSTQNPIVVDKNEKEVE